MMKKMMAAMAAVLTMCSAGAMSVHAVTDEQLEEIRAAMLAESWDGMTTETRAAGIENSMYAAYVYGLIGEFLIEYRDGHYGYTLDSIDVNKTNDVARICGEYGEWWADDSKYAGESYREADDGTQIITRADGAVYTVMEQDDAWVYVDANGNEAERYERLTQFTYLNTSFYDSTDIVYMPIETEKPVEIGTAVYAENNPVYTGAVSTNAGVVYTTAPAATTTTAEASEQEQSSGSNAGYFIAAGAIVVVGGAAIYLLKNKSQK